MMKRHSMIATTCHCSSSHTITTMPPFGSRSSRPHALLSAVRKHPFALFGLPFLSIVVVSSVALKTFTQTRYDLDTQKVSTLSREEELGMDKERKKVDIREEYFVSIVLSIH